MDSRPLSRAELGEFLSSAWGRGLWTLTRAARASFIVGGRLVREALSLSLDLVVLWEICPSGPYFLICSWSGEGRARAPLMGPHCLHGHQLSGKNKHSSFSTRFLSPWKLSSHNRPLGRGEPRVWCGGSKGSQVRGSGELAACATLSEPEHWAVQIDIQKQL